MNIFSKIDYSFGKVLTLRQMSLTQFEVSGWNPTSKTRLQKQWTLPYTESFKCFDLYSLLSFEDSDVGVVHAIVYCAGSARVAEKQLLFGIRIVENGPIKDLWNDFSLSPGGRCQVHKQLISPHDWPFRIFSRNAFASSYKFQLFSF